MKDIIYCNTQLFLENFVHILEIFIFQLEKLGPECMN